MQPLSGRSTKIEAAVPIGIGQVELVRNFWSEPIDTFGTAHEHG